MLNIPERRKTNEEVFLRLEEKIDDISRRVCVHQDHHEYIAKVMEREARKEAFHRAIIEKTTISLLWSFLVGVAYLCWQGITAHWKW
jgi:hypothetical protein